MRSRLEFAGGATDPDVVDDLVTDTQMSAVAAAAAPTPPVINVRRENPRRSEGPTSVDASASDPAVPDPTGTA